MANYYKILEVSQEATLKEIKKAYRSLALKYHPDVNTEQDAHQKFILLNKAYLILSDTEARSKYDNEYFCSKVETPDQSYKPNGKSYVNEEFNDPDLNRWANNAKNQANKYASMPISEFTDLLKGIMKETATQGFNAFIYAISAVAISGSIITLIAGIIEFSPEKIIIGIVLFVISLFGISASSKNYDF